MQMRDALEIAEYEFQAWVGLDCRKNWLGEVIIVEAEARDDEATIGLTQKLQVARQKLQMRLQECLLVFPFGRVDQTRIRGRGRCVLIDFRAFSAPTDRSMQFQKLEYSFCELMTFSLSPDDVVAEMLAIEPPPAGVGESIDGHHPEVRRCCLEAHVIVRGENLEARVSDSSSRQLLQQLPVSRNIGVRGP